MANNSAIKIQERRRETIETSGDLGPQAVEEISAALRELLADVFVLYLKTKNFHWHMSGPHFRDYHLLLDEHADQIFAMTDDRNSPAPAGLAPVVVGLLVVLIGATFGFNAGYAINPARDFGPRLFTFVAGWGGEVFRAGNNWWWVPIVAPCVGGVLGAWVYDALVGDRFPARSVSTEVHT